MPKCAVDLMMKLKISLNYINTWASHMVLVVKNPPANARDPSLIPGTGRFAGKGIGYPLQYTWASLVALLVKNLPAIWETWV